MNEVNQCEIDGQKWRNIDRKADYELCNQRVKVPLVGVCFDHAFDVNL